MPEPLLIKTPRLYDGASEAAVDRAYVVIEDGRITDVGAQSALGASADASFQRTVVLGDDTTLLPGLINMHTHLSFSARSSMFDDQLHESDATKMIRIVENLHAALGCGITTVRDCGTWPRLLLPARDAVESGLLTGPRVVASGAITITGGHCWFCAREADTEDEMRKAVRAHVKDGVDFIKLFATGGNSTPGSNSLVAQYTQAQLCAGTDEARKANRRTAAHAHGVEGVRNAITARVTTIEHCSFQSPQGIGWDGAMADEIVDAGIYVCPTVFRGVAKRVGDPHYQFSARDENFVARREERFVLTRRLADHGVKLVSGNDCGVPHCEIADYPGDLVSTVEDAELSALTVIRSATGVAAEALGRHDIGVIARGRVADLLAVQGNPLEDIRALERTVGVFARGRQVV